MYVWLRICPDVGTRLVTVQFDGMGTAAGPPARMVGVVTGSALLKESMFAASNNTVEGNVKCILNDRGNSTLVDDVKLEGVSKLCVSLL